MMKPIHVEPLPGYRLRVRYDDGVEGDVDLSHLVGKGVFSIWRDPKRFEDVRIGSGGELRWGEDVDLCADAIYMTITGKSPEQAFANFNGISANASDQSFLRNDHQDSF